MSRETGFAVVDLDVGILHDPKVIRLARAIRDEERTAAHIGLYVALLAESWRTGERVRLEDALPAWWMADVEQFAKALRDAGLIDAEDRIPEKSCLVGSALRSSVAKTANAKGGSAVSFRMG